MKKTILNFAFVMGLSIQSQAQAPLQIGENQLNVGIGTSSWGLPLYVGLDHGIHEDISVGGELSYPKLQLLIPRLQNQDIHCWYISQRELPFQSNFEPAFPVEFVCRTQCRILFVELLQQ